MLAMQFVVALLALLVPSWSQPPSNCNSIYEVRLEGKPKCSNGGNLEICWRENNQKPLQWQRVCDSIFRADDDVAASVVCRQLGFNSMTGHRAVSYFMSCMEGVQLQDCPNSATSVQNCSISEMSTLQAFGVICDVSPQEMQSCLSAQFSTPSPTSQSSSNEASAEHKCSAALMGGLLGAVIGILATVLVGLLVGWTYYNSRRPQSQQIMEGPRESHFNNTYDITTCSHTTSLSNQRAPPTRADEKGNTEPLYHVLKRPSAKEKHQHSSQRPAGGETEGRDYGVISKDATGLSYEVPITTRNTREGLEEDDYQEPQDHLINQLAMAQT